MTLIEVLIAVTLVGLLSVGMLWAIRVGVGAMGKANERLMSNRRVTGSRRVLEQQLEGLIPVNALVANRKIAFFQGEPQSMRFVSSYSLQEGSRGRPQILEFQVIAGEEGRGVRLIVNELGYTGPRSAGAMILGRDAATGTHFTPIEAGPQSFVLADKLAYCNFSYQEARARPEIERWDTQWILDKLPLAIRIDMAPLEDTGGRLHMTSITQPVRITRVPTETYEDE